MYLPKDLARFTLLEFERGLAGLTDEEARTRVDKADGAQMNAVSWVVCHIAWHWLSLASLATGERAPSGLRPFATGPKADPTPPPFADALALLAGALDATAWVASAEDGRLSDAGRGDENLGTSLMRAVLHTWYHLGEIAAMRQVMGLEEVAFVGRMVDSLEWRGAPGGTEPSQGADAP
jgi:hypothetical protein